MVIAPLQAPMAATIFAAGPMIVSLRLIGIPRPHELQDLSQTVVAYPKRGVTLSLDLRQLDATQASTHAVRRLAAFLGELGGKGLRRVAVVAAQDRALYGIARMLQLHVDSAGVEAHCFRDDMLAAQWLAAVTGNELPPRRAFTSPSGRRWTAELYELPRSLGVRTADGTIPAHAVLRFSGGDVTLDLRELPPDWDHRTDDQLIELLRQASVPSFAPLSIVA